MLTETEILENKKQYLELLSTLNIDLTNFVRYLDSQRVDFFNKPFSIYAESGYCGSLCAHCLAVYNELIKLSSLYCPNKYSQDTLIKAALFKDLYRAELYECYNKNQKNEQTNQWETVQAYRTKELRPVFGSIGFSSYMIAQKFFDLSQSDELIEAICYASLSEINMVDSYAIHINYPLITLLTMAEMAVQYKL